MVSADRLVECVWGEAAPSSARHVLHTYVSQLRAALGDGVSLRTQPPGYVLELDGERLDASRFERRLRAARDAEDAETALALLEEALSEWRGPVAADLEVEGDAHIAARRLEALRVEAIEARADAALALGRHAELVADLEQLVATEPLRERPREQLMLALYRSGRQSAALAAYRDARHHFSSELGIEPGPELRRLERAILEHDPSLAAPKPASALPSAGARRHASRVVAAVGVVAAVATGAVVVSLILVGHARGVTLRPGGVGALDGASGRVLASPLDGGAADALAVADGNAWVGRASPRSVVEIDARHRVVRSVPLPEPAYALAAAGSSVWVAPAYDGTIERLVGNHLARPYRPTPTSRGRLALVADDDFLWIAGQDGYLTRIDTRSGRVTSHLRIGTSNGLASGFGGIWVASTAADAIIHVDARTGRIVGRIPIGGIPASVIAGPGGVWAATPAEGSIWRIDPHRNDVLASTGPVAQPNALAAADGRIWVSSRSSGALVALDPQSERVVAHIDLPTPAAHLAGFNHELWVTLLPASS